MYFCVEFACEKCGREFGAKSNLLRHRYMHNETKLKCLRCSFTTKVPSRLRAHERYVHKMDVKEDDGMAPELLECYICHQQFRDMKWLRFHMTRMHPMRNCNEKVSISDTPDSNTDHTESVKLVYNCDNCGRQFPTRILLETHRREAHFACATCNKWFHTPLQLKIHEKMDCGERSKLAHLVLWSKQLHSKLTKNINLVEFVGHSYRTYL